MASRADRIIVLADAAIGLLAERGARGLTHRAVDGRAGLPLGSTSAYLRTRRALFEAVAQRLADLDRADLAAGRLPTGATPAPLDPTDLDGLADGIARVLDRWLSAGRERTLARYACLLEAGHHPQLRTVLAHGTGYRSQAADLLAAAGAPDARRRGPQFVAFVDGLLFDRLVGAGALHAPPPGTAESVADLRAAVRLLLAACTGPEPGPP